MYSDCAPNRNPAEVSFAAVDRRLSRKQRNEILNIAEYYHVTSYYLENPTTNSNDTACIIDEFGYTLCYVDYTGNIISVH